MKFIGIKEDRDTGEIEYNELNFSRQQITCFYKDRYGVYICTNNGRMFKVHHTIDELTEKLDVL